MTDQSPLNQQFSNHMTDVGLCPDQSFAVAVSGGADSMALLHLMADWVADAGKLHCLSVDHGLRSDAADECAFVARVAKTLGVNHHTLSVVGPSPEADVQAWARTARYQVMEGFCLEHGIGNLILAHHGDDQAETLVMRMLRGSGVDGLSGMQAIANPITQAREPRLVRPLLPFSKDQLLAYLSELRQVYVDDPSNQNEAFKRVRVRQFLAQQPERDILTDRLRETASRFQRVKNYLDRQVNKALEAICDRDEAFGYATMDRAAFCTLDEEIAFRVLTRLLRSIGGNLYPPRMRDLTSLWGQLRADDFKALTVSGVQFKKQADGRLLICREVGRINQKLYGIQQNPLYWDQRFMIKTRVPATCQVAALGEKGWQWLKKQEGIETDSLPARLVCMGLPALWSDGEVVDVPYELGGKMRVIFMPKNAFIKKID